ncbi:tyrosine-protein phosphatase non-receptor type 5-like isoform X2 [Chelonus insularis]|uniref:tyrosine-protein phosphatase non-receptor type 5-like isoform X2 n=1 Tax=Chelonus insularis TaxID=460826 RepID=UPI00158E1857|nr:tyrosine-protein phosphatase non-receptor type 5-like isoform X2 [Chelonus insularis]
MQQCNFNDANTGTTASQYMNDVNNYQSIHDNNEANSVEQIYLINEQRWQGKAVLPISLLSVAEGMSARSHHRIRQSGLGLDDAAMDVQTPQLGTRTGQEISSTTTISWTDWKIPFPVIVCAFAGAILFTFLLLLWLRKQMSSEKKSGGGDRRELVEKGTSGSPPSSSLLPSSSSTSSEKPEKSSQSWQMEPQWVHKPFVKIPTPSQPTCRLSEASTSTSGPSTVIPVVTEKRPEPIRVKTKGLLERRGSSASLTIELAPAPESPPHVITPMRECILGEFLLSTGNSLSRTQLRQAVQDPTALHKEFWEVPLNIPDKVEILGVAMKNRYSSVLPNTQSRVILEGSEDPASSYINANYIRGYDGENNRYIATQGPLANTITDFWRMIWMDKVRAIVMITRFFESSKAKCDVYFPLEKDNRIQSGPFTVIVSSVVNRDGYTVRDLELKYEGFGKQNVTHYWYDSWPDHSVPQAPDALVSLAAEVNTLPAPVVVHCSAGIGRTGCFIALATGMTQLVKDGNVDVLKILCQMRYDRGGMIQTGDQYEFVHRALCLFEQTLDSGKKSKSGD